MKDFLWVFPILAAIGIDRRLDSVIRLSNRFAIGETRKHHASLCRFGNQGGRCSQR